MCLSDHSTVLPKSPVSGTFFCRVSGAYSPGRSVIYLSVPQQLLSWSSPCHKWHSSCSSFSFSASLKFHVQVFFFFPNMFWLTEVQYFFRFQIFRGSDFLCQPMYVARNKFSLSYLTVNSFRSQFECFFLREYWLTLQFGSHFSLL